MAKSILACKYAFIHDNGIVCKLNSRESIIWTFFLRGNGEDVEGLRGEEYLPG